MIFDGDETGSAQFTNDGTSQFSGSGRPTVMRYIPAGTNNRRAYRFVTSSVNTTTSIYENWQTSGVYEVGLGIHITGSTTGANGFDQTVSGNPSMLEYTEDSGAYAWRFITATNDPNTTTDNLIAGKALNMFIRGDRNPAYLTSSSTPLVNLKLPAKGTLVTSSSVGSGALNPNAGGFDFVGNPYQATIDMTMVTKNNINPNFIYIWNPNAASFGAYETIAVDALSTEAARFVEPGQSFFVVTDATGPSSLTFNATDKAPSQTNGGSFSMNTTRPFLNVALWSDNAAPTVFDTAKFFFDGDNVVDNRDAPEIGNFEENFSINKNGVLLSIENRSMPVDNEVITFDFSNVSNSNYELRVELENLVTNLNALLVDNYTNSATAINSGMNNIPFSVNLSDPNSFLNDRFTMRFEETTLSSDRILTLGFQMYPNPTTSNLLNINLANGFENGAASFYNLLGQEITSIDMDSQFNLMNIQNLKAGIYLVKVVSGTYSMTQKLVIK